MNRLSAILALYHAIVCGRRGQSDLSLEVATDKPRGGSDVHLGPICCTSAALALSNQEGGRVVQ